MKPLIVLVLLVLVTCIAAHKSEQQRSISRVSRRKKPFRPSNPLSWDGKSSVSVAKVYEHTVDVQRSYEGKGNHAIPRYSSRQTKPKTHRSVSPKRHKKKSPFKGKPRTIKKQHFRPQMLPAAIKISQFVTDPARKGMSKVHGPMQTMPVRPPVSQFDLELRNFDDTMHTPRVRGRPHSNARMSNLRPLKSSRSHLKSKETTPHYRGRMGDLYPSLGQRTSSSSHMHAKSRSSLPGAAVSLSSSPAFTYPHMSSRNFDSRMNNYDSMWDGSALFNGDAHLLRGNQVPIHTINNWNGDNSRWEHNNADRSWGRGPNYDFNYDDRSTSSGRRRWDGNRNYNDNNDWSGRRRARMNNNNEPLDWRTVRWNRNDYYNNDNNNVNNNNGDHYYYGYWHQLAKQETSPGGTGTITDRGARPIGLGRLDDTGGLGDWYGRNWNRNDSNNGWDMYNYDNNNDGMRVSSSTGRRLSSSTGRRLSSRLGYYYDLDNGDDFNYGNDWNNNGDTYYAVAVGRDNGRFWDRNNDGNNFNNDNGRTYWNQRSWGRNNENNGRYWYGRSWDRNNDGNDYNYRRRGYGLDNIDNYDNNDRRRWYGINSDTNGNSNGRRRWYGLNGDRNGNSVGRRRWYGLNRDRNGDNNGRRSWYGVNRDSNRDSNGRRRWYGLNWDRYNDNTGSSRRTVRYGPRRITTIGNGRLSRYSVIPYGNYDNDYNNGRLRRYGYPSVGTGRRWYAPRRGGNDRNNNRGDRTLESGTRRGNTVATGKGSRSTTRKYKDNNG